MTSSIKSNTRYEKTGEGQYTIWFGTQTDPSGTVEKVTNSAGTYWVGRVWGERAGFAAGTRHEAAHAVLCA